MEIKETTQEHRMTIHDMAGVQVRELIFSRADALNNLPCGTYIIKFKGTDGKVLSNKLVIVRP